MPPENPFDENAQYLDAWRADPERDRETFFLRDVKNLPRIDAPSAWPEFLILAALAGVIAYFVLRLVR